MAYEHKKDIFEILNEVEETSSRPKKKKILQENDSMALRDILRATYDENIQWNLPEGEPPYEENRPESTPSSIYRQHMNLKFFVKGFNSSERLTAAKREKMFIGMLESVHPEDAKVLLKMKNKEQLAKGLTEKLIKEVFPGLIP